MSNHETLEQLGARLFHQGGGISSLWYAAPDTNQETMDRMLDGFLQAMHTHNTIAETQSKK